MLVDLSQVVNEEEAGVGGWIDLFIIYQVKWGSCKCEISLLTQFGGGRIRGGWNLEKSMLLASSQAETLRSSSSRKEKEKEKTQFWPV